MKKTMLYPDHPRPVTRRDFIKTGMIQFSSTLLTPTLLSQVILQHQARAAGCSNAAGASGSELIPFLVFDMAGGAALPGNFLVGGKGGSEDLLSSYNQLGWDPRSAGALDRSFGLPMAAQASQILSGLKQAASPEAQALLRMGSFCNFSRDDTSDNPLSALTLVSKAGYKGSIFPNGLASENSASGGNSSSGLADLTLKPMHVARVEDVEKSLSYGPAFAGFSDKELKALGKSIHDMSVDQMTRFGRLGLGNQMAQLSECALSQNMQFGSKIPGLDPRQDQDIQAIYSIEGSQSDSVEAVSAAVVMNVLRGNSGPGALTVGGCDYHDGSQSTGDGKDREMGQQIGRAIEAAYRLKKPLFFQLITDGGVYADPGTRNWRGDASIKSLTVIGFFNPSGAPSQRRTQVGSYVDGQAVDQTTTVGGEPAKVAYAVLANYLNACGKLKAFDQLAPRSFFSAAQMDEILIFG